MLSALLQVTTACVGNWAILPPNTDSPFALEIRGDSTYHVRPTDEPEYSGTWKSNPGQEGITLDDGRPSYQALVKDCRSDSIEYKNIDSPAITLSPFIGDFYAALEERGYQSDPEEVETQPNRPSFADRTIGRWRINLITTDTGRSCKLENNDRTISIFYSKGDIRNYLIASAAFPADKSTGIRQAVQLRAWNVSFDFGNMNIYRDPQGDLVHAKVNAILRDEHRFLDDFASANHVTVGMDDILVGRYSLTGSGRAIEAFRSCIGAI